MMRKEEYEKLERELRELCQRGNFTKAVARALKEFGPEIMGLMSSIIHDYDRSQEAYSQFSENLLRGLPGFRWESSFRTWVYRLARNACYQLMRGESARSERRVNESELSEVPINPRSVTHPWQRTSVKSRLHVLFESLDPRQRTLLFLRIEQRLPWKEVARVMAEEEWELTDVELTRKAATLRQQFKQLKDHLRALFQKEGLLVAEEAPQPM
jgi:RNA polymerase sigma-70 factor (ECF subfamily)